ARHVAGSAAVCNRTRTLGQRVDLPGSHSGHSGHRCDGQDRLRASESWLWSSSAAFKRGLQGAGVGSEFPASGRGGIYIFRSQCHPCPDVRGAETADCLVPPTLPEEIGYAACAVPFPGPAYSRCAAHGPGMARDSNHAGPTATTPRRDLNATRTRSCAIEGSDGWIGATQNSARRCHRRRWVSLDMNDLGYFRDLLTVL